MSVEGSLNARTVTHRRLLSSDGEGMLFAEVALAEPGTGVPIASLVPELGVWAPYKQSSSWRPVLYRPFVALDAEDENVVRRALEPGVGSPSSERIASYATE